MYTEQELSQVKETLTKRRWLVCAPCAAVLALAIAVFVYGQLTRNDSLWLVTVGLTVLGGGAFLFFYGVYLRPMRYYRQHVERMLHGVKRETMGVWKSFSDALCERDGISCHSMYINVGDSDEEQDDRLFYYDACKPQPAFAAGARVTVVSNDKMVADIREA